jgi:3-deoxy-D-manno-octulosonate 8-phosphate phosphatase (KDO 8-P phosphatase)
VRQGVANKMEAYEEILITQGLADEDVAYMGDDLVDLGVLSRVGLSAAPLDAVAEVRARVDWISTERAAFGAARELVELVLRAQHRWEDLVTSYLNETSPAP